MGVRTGEKRAFAPLEIGSKNQKARGARAPISCLAPQLLHSSNIVFRKWDPPDNFWSPLLWNPGDGPDIDPLAPLAMPMVSSG